MSIGYFTSNGWNNIQGAADELRAYIADLESRSLSDFEVKTEADEAFMNAYPQLAEIKDDPVAIKNRILDHLYGVANSLEKVVDGFRAAEEMSYRTYSPAGFLYVVEEPKNP